MDNIKKFEDFLDRMQGLLDNAKKQGRIIVPVEDLENAFPELKESDDERIRKVIIEHFEGSHSCMYPYKGFTKEQILAWLKKQGDIIENNMLLPFKEYDNLMDSINKKKKEGYEAGYKQGLIDSKNDQHVQPKFKIGDTIRVKSSSAEYVITDIYGGCYHGKGWSLDIISADRSGDYELVEQKPAWSEEDEDMFKRFVYLIPQCMAANGYNELFNWLKSLKERVQSQPKQEWSEEDENRFRNLIYLVENSNEGKGTKEGFIKFINRLKSLKERYTWKPSDEQMDLLQYLCKTSSHPNEEVIPTLESLYKDLKKLKEE